MGEFVLPVDSSGARRDVWTSRVRAINVRTVLLEGLILLAFVVLSSVLLGK